MKIIPLSIFALAICFSTSADAKFADKRSFMHPLGFWSNEGYVKQREVYPRRYRNWVELAPYDADPCCGGGILHERNW